jgi:hypothetical protein
VVDTAARTEADELFESLAVKYIPGVPLEPVAVPAPG